MTDTPFGVPRRVGLPPAVWGIGIVIAAEGMLFTKLLLSRMPHARVRRIDTSRATALPGVRAILTADDLPDLRGAERALTNEPLYQGEPILAVAAVDELTAADAIERI